MNGGTCNVVATGQVCICPAGFIGASCEEAICLATSCLNGGTCTDGRIGSVPDCFCEVGFTGLRCETDIDYCRPEYCINGGTCVEGVGTAISCSCPPGISKLV